MGSTWPARGKNQRLSLTVAQIVEQIEPTGRPGMPRPP
jgi:hypothetical protein